MIVTSNRNTVTKSQNIKSIRMTMKAVPKSFHSVINTLYSNKIKAFIREITTNAVESHQLSNVDRPIDVTLPTQESPSFSVRDYGSGLSPQDITNIYSVVFESTKSNTNQVGGCHGLGSKSPLAYTRMFNVTSYYCGTKYEYIVHYDEEDYPCFSLLNSCTTSEPNGLLVSVPIGLYDISDIKDDVDDVYSYFSAPININGKLYTTSNFYKYKCDDYYIPENRIYVVVMGNIAYPMPEEYIKKINWLHGLRLNVQIGDVTPHTSREHLVLDNTTKATLDKLTQRVGSDLLIGNQKNIDNCDCLWNAKILLENIRSTYGIYSHRFTYRNQSFDYICVKELPHGIAAYRADGHRIKKGGLSLNTIFYVRDVKKSPILRIVESDTNRGTRVVINNDVELLQKAKDLLGITDGHIKSINALPEFQKQTKVKAPKQTSSVRMCRLLSGASKILPASFKYIKTYRDKAVDGNGKHIPLHEIDYVFRFLQMSIDDIYCIPSSKERFINNQCEDILVQLHDKMEKSITDKMILSHEYHDLVKYTNDVLLAMCLKNLKLSASDMLAESTVNKHKLAIKAFDTNIKTHKYGILKKEKDEILKKYPCILSVPYQAIKYYVYGVDNMKGKK